MSIDKKITNVIDFPARPSGLGSTVFQQAMATALHKPLPTKALPPPSAPVSKAPVSTIASGITSTTTGTSIQRRFLDAAKKIAAEAAAKRAAAAAAAAAGKSALDPTKFNTPPTTGATQGGTKRPTKFKKGDKDPVINGLQQHLIAWGFATAK